MKLLPRFVKGIKTKMIPLSSGECCSGDSYIQEALKKSQLKVSKVWDRGDKDTFYFLFENLFRGSIEEIKRRQSIYLPYVTEAHAHSKGLFFLDAGCGRGEFLDLLKGQGIPAKGVDISRINTEWVKEMDGNVVLSDALEYLKTLEDDSLIGLSMFQVIEHLDFEQIRHILKAAFKKISLHGVIIVESVNPYCSMALGKFYLDPTHKRPYAPDLMKFMLEWHRFEKVGIIYSSPILRRVHFRRADRKYQDYAVVGKKMER
jgi:SAM-dependent methyltransferase